MTVPSRLLAGPPAVSAPGPEPPAPEAVPPAHRHPGARLVAALRPHPAGAAAGLVVGLTVLAALAAPWLAPYDPLEPDFLAMLAPPSREHPFGTDAFGRDVLSRILYGARPALMVGVSSAFIGASLGALVAAVSAYYGRRIDLIVQRFIEMAMAFPILILALAIVALLGPGLTNTVVAITLPILPRVARVVRAEALVVRQAPYMEAARAVGAGDRRIIWRHMLPNLLNSYLVMLTVHAGQAILLEASLSFLGLGVAEPTPAWGLMLRGSAIEFAERAPWLAIFPGLAIAATVLAFNVLGDALRDALDPRLRSR